MDGQYYIKQVQISWRGGGGGVGMIFINHLRFVRGIYRTLRNQQIQSCRVWLCSVYTAKTWWPKPVWRGSLVLQRPLAQRLYIGTETVNPVRVLLLKMWALARGCTYLGRGMHFLCTEYSLLISHVSTEPGACTGDFFLNSSTQMGHLLHTGHIQAHGGPARACFENHNKCSLVHRLWLCNFESPVCW